MTDRFHHINSADIPPILHRYGFVLISQRGSHQKWHNYASGKQVIVPLHRGKELPGGTLFSIINGSGIPEAEFH